VSVHKTIISKGDKKKKLETETRREEREEGQEKERGNGEELALWLSYKLVKCCLSGCVSGC